LDNTFIGFFKDTSLVLDHRHLRLPSTAPTRRLVDPAWAGFRAKSTLFAAFIYFCFCFSMSRYSKYLEVELNRGNAPLDAARRTDNGASVAHDLSNAHVGDHPHRRQQVVRPVSMC